MLENPLHRPIPNTPPAANWRPRPRRPSLPPGSSALASPQAFYSQYGSTSYLFQAPYTTMAYGQPWTTAAVPLRPI